MLTLLLLVFGFVLLIAGGDLLVRGAVRIAAWAGMSPLLVGLTVVSMGTSEPELAASAQAALAGSPGLALGNIVGSNLANLLLILGCAALVHPLSVERSTLWRDGGVGVLAALALIAAGWTLGLGRIAGGLFLLGTAAYLTIAYRQERLGTGHGAAWDKAQAAEAVDPALIPPIAGMSPARGELGGAAALLLLGLGLIVGGARLMVGNAIVLAGSFGVPDAVVGLTIVAIGTSLPELVTSVVAALRRESAIALGNVLGSNIFNILFIGGVTGLVAPGSVPLSILQFDLLLVLGAAVVVMVFAWTGGRLSRREGALLLAAYGAYLVHTVRTGLAG